MAVENVALINKFGQVVNNIIVDPDDKELMDALHEQWDTHRHAISGDQPILLHEDPNTWTTHCDDDECEKQGFNLPDPITWAKALGIKIEETPLEDPEPREFEEITIKGKKYPSDSLLIKENADKRPVGWILPEGAEEVSLADKE